MPGAVLLGFVIGTAAVDLLNAAGLHWLGWPLTALLLLVILVGSAVMRRHGQRS
jgi:hypothetical protein